MKLTSVKIFQYALVLQRPLFVKGQEVHEREGLILQVECDQNFVGFGEIAPLPGFSRETLAEALDQIQKLRPFLLAEEIPENLKNFSGEFNEWLEPFGLVSSVQCGIEMALMNLFANILNKPLNKILTDEYHERIGIAGLLQGTQSEVIAQAKDLIAQGYKSLKLKVGDNVEEDIKKVQALNAETSELAILHVDANQKWSFNDAIAFGNEVGLAAVEYIEEPFKDIEQIPDYFMKTTIPSALDETLMDKSFNDVKSIEGVDFLVLKPMMMGGIEKAWQIMQEAKRLAIETVISSSFESGIGILTLANLAGSLRRDHSSGLDTLKWFHEDLLLSPLVVEKGSINIKDRQIQKADIDFTHLKEI